MQTLLRLMLLLTLAVISGTASAGSQETAISSMLHGMFDKPDAKLMVNPIIISGDHAIAGWAQGDMGGRALLRRQHDKWTIVLCAGDEIKTSASMVKAGVPAGDASHLEQELARAEANLDPAERAMFSRFDGIMLMDAASNHRH